MSYKCQITGKVAHEKLNKVVVETRAKTYTHWDHEAEENWTSQGVEIVKEVDACAAGVALWDSWNAEERAQFLKQL